jgi:hypothetical protein
VVTWFEGPDLRRSVDAADDVRSEEAWLACVTCRALIDADDRDRLAERGAVRRARGDGGLPDSELVRNVRADLEDTFWAARHG